VTSPTHRRDPRLRRAGGVFAPPIDAAAAAVRLVVAADAMRAEQLAHGPELEAPVTAQEFADALAVPLDEVPEPAQVEPGDFAEPAPAAPVVVSPPPPPVPAPAQVPAAFSSERRPLTWASRHDPRSLDFGVRSRLVGSAPITDHVWPVGPVLDQGKEGECVGCGVVDAANVLELVAGQRAGLGIADAASVYHRAQQIDDIPGENYTGTSVLAGMQAAVEAGYFGGYLWAFGTRDIAQAVLQVGPVIIGIPWCSGMYDTGPGGLVQVAGDVVGGHCLAVVGIRLKGPQGQPGPYFTWMNSWGPTYGDHGLGYIHHKDLAGLLRGTGEAAVPTRGTP
jgi:hypothetical protein